MRIDAWGVRPPLGCLPSATDQDGRGLCGIGRQGKFYYLWQVHVQGTLRTMQMRLLLAAPAARKNNARAKQRPRCASSLATLAWVWPAALQTGW